MTQAVAKPCLKKPLTLEQFLKWDDGTGILYELVDGISGEKAQIDSLTFPELELTAEKVLKPGW